MALRNPLLGAGHGERGSDGPGIADGAQDRVGEIGAGQPQSAPEVAAEAQDRRSSRLEDFDLGPAPKGLVICRSPAVLGPLLAALQGPQPPGRVIAMEQEVPPLSEMWHLSLHYCDRHQRKRTMKCHSAAPGYLAPDCPIGARSYVPIRCLPRPVGVTAVLNAQDTHFVLSVADFIDDAVLAAARRM